MTNEDHSFSARVVDWLHIADSQPGDRLVCLFEIPRYNFPKGTVVHVVTNNITELRVLVDIGDDVGVFYIHEDFYSYLMNTEESRG